MTLFHRALTITASLTAAAHLAGCITVEPTSTTGKAAVKTSRVIKAISPSSKPVMAIPASTRKQLKKAETQLACTQAGASKKRLVVIEENDAIADGGRIVSNIEVDCSKYQAEPTPEQALIREAVGRTPARTQPVYTAASVPAESLRTIRVAVDGGPAQMFEIDETGTARPAASHHSASQIHTAAPAYTPTETYVYEQPQTYQASSTSYSSSYRVRRGDTLYSIARRNCVALEALTDANSIRRPYTIQPDQVLVLPNGGC